MVWAKVDDQYPLHRKILPAGIEALGFDVAGWCYCNRYETDGFIADDLLPTVYPPLKNPKKVADKLVEVGRWDRVRGGYRVHDFLEFNPSAEQVRTTRQARSEAGSRGASKANSPANSRTNSPANSSANSSANETANPQQTAEQLAEQNGRPVSRIPLPQEPVTPETNTSPPAEASFAAFWKRYPPRSGKKLDKGKALTVWKRLTLAQRDRALIAVENYRAACDAEITLAKDAHRWLSGKAFEDWQTPAETKQGYSNESEWTDEERGLA